MSYPIYMVPAGDVLPVFFTTYGKTNGESITATGLLVSDIEVYKDGGTAQRSSDAGYALLDGDGIDVDGVTGLHGFSIDTGDNTDPGFYTIGAWYHVVVSTITVDSQTVTFIACAFRLMPAESAAGVPEVALSAAAIDAILDDQVGDGTITVRQAMRVLIAGMAGKLSGAATTTITIRNLADSANVVVATVDASGNRSAVTVTP